MIIKQKSIRQEDGIHAKEINPITIYDVRIDLPAWKEAESKLRTFEIKLDKCQCPLCLYSISPVYYGKVPHSEYIYSAEILDNDKLIIK